jgi:hypothetical protein
MPGILVDATQTKAEPAGAGGAAGPPVVYRTIGAYFLGAGTEFLLYTQVRATIYSRVEAAIAKTVASFAAPKPTGSGGAKGGPGSYHDEKSGFKCKVPPGYSVRVPARPQHVVEFVPPSDAPVIGVFAFESPDDLDKEAKALVDYYRGEEVGGEAETGPAEISGRSAVVVTANGTLEGKTQVFFVAVLKRDQTTFRLRVAADKAQEAKAKEVFDAFVGSFAMTN